ncbi:MAG: hypothetical protein WBN57_00415 [Gammaproteobacteria bacterium]
MHIALWRGPGDRKVSPGHRKRDITTRHIAPELQGLLEAGNKPMQYLAEIGQRPGC